MSNFKVTLTEAVPDTGLFTSTDNSSGIAIGAGTLMLLFAVIAIIWALVVKHRNHRNFQSSKFRLRMAKRTILGLSVLTVMTGVFSLAISHQAKEINSASATDGTAGATSSTTSEETDALSIKVSDFELAVVPKEDGAFGYAYQTVTVGVPTNAGYTLSAYASSENLINSENKESVISGMEATVGAAALGTNTWGMSLDKPEDANSGVWSKMPSTAETATIVDYVSSATKKDNESKIYYGVNVNKDLAYGDYTNTIVYVAVANMSISDIDCMQDFANLSYLQSSSVYNSMTEGEQYQLKDSRDEKTYYVSKLADGNVWMTQNLDLNLDSTKTFTPADTDISTNWTPSASTIEFTGTTVNGWEGSNTTPESADPGDTYYYTSGSSSDDTTYASLTACTAANHTAEECVHYHAGNYYNWSAAVASNDTSSIERANGSICPAGWRLPNGRNATDHTSSDFYGLLDAYDIIGNFNNNSQDYAYKENGFNNIRKAPLWLTRSGDVIHNDISGSSTTIGAASVGYYQTNTIYTNVNNSNYILMFGSNTNDPNAGISLSSGLSIRCVLQLEPFFAQ